MKRICKLDRTTSVPKSVLSLLYVRCLDPELGFNWSCSKSKEFKNFIQMFRYLKKCSAFKT